MKKPKLLNTLICCLLLVTHASAIVTNINSGATHEVIQDAVDAAASGDTLLISTGQYDYVSLNIGNKDLEIKGGYSEDFSTYISPNATILNAENYCAAFNFSTSIVEGLTFTGAITGMDLNSFSFVTARFCRVINNISFFPGAGVYVHDNGILVLENTDIENNSATNSDANGNGGGGFVSSGGKIIVSDNSRIFNNSATTRGGGLYNNNAYIEIRSNASVYANSSGKDGGGIFCAGGSLLIHNGANIGIKVGDPNTAAGNGGGICAENSAAIIIKDPTTFLINNYAEKRGGAIYLDKSSLAIYNFAQIGYQGLACSNSAAWDGGGIFASQSSVAITNSKINNCRAENGGAIFSSSSAIILYNCEIGSTNDLYTNKSVKFGGAIYSFGGNYWYQNSVFVNNQAGINGGAVELFNSDTFITNSVFRDNKAQNNGGAINSGLSDNAVKIIAGTIVSNSAVYGGGIWWDSNTNLTIRKSVISGNTAVQDGGGILAKGSGLTLLDDVQMIKNKASESGGGVALFDGTKLFAYNCYFEQNESTLNGGGIYVSNSTLLVRGNVSVGEVNKAVFYNNKANSEGAGGAVCFERHSTSEFYNVMIMNNFAGSGGGGIASEYSDSYFQNVLITDNNCSYLNYGDGVHLFASDVVLECCTVAENDRIGVYANNTSSAALTNCVVWGHSIYGVTTNPVHTVAFSDIEGGYQGEGNINSDPLFWDPANYKYQILIGSPCIDVGTNSSWMLPPATDLAGNERKHDGIVDMGCYEFIPEPFCLSIIIYFLFFITRKFKV